MNLKKSYNSIKGKNRNLVLMQVCAVICAIAIYTSVFYVIHLMWNDVAPIWGLPVLTYLQFLATFTFIKLLSIFLFGFKVARYSQRDYDPTPKIIHMFKDHPNEEQ